MHYFSILFW